MKIDIKKVPNTPGVYKFFNNQEIIYIGKAKDLKKRVSSYFGKSFKDRKTSQIKFLTDKVETFSTKNEVEALLLEQMLIKENKPKFNILLRDDKTYPYIYFSLDHEYPGVYSKRTKKSVDNKYFGPFVSSEAVKKSIKEMQKIFRVRNCSDNTFANRTRPCIEFQMKRCSAPCVQKINKVDYFEDITSAKSFLSSSDTKNVQRLTNQIEKAVVKLDFEKAAEIRDRLKRLNLLKEEQSVVTLANDIDIFSVSSEMSYLGVSIIVVRNGKIRGTKTHLIKQAHYISLDDVYQSAMFNFYENQIDIPKKVLCAYELKDKKVLGILDWEHAHIGNPAYDLGYFHPMADKLASWSVFLDAYADTGIPMPNQDQINYSILLGATRVGVMVCQVRSAFLNNQETGMAASIGIAGDYYDMAIIRISKALETVL